MRNPTPKYRVVVTPTLTAQMPTPARATFSPWSPPLFPIATDTSPRINPTPPRRSPNGFQKNTMRLKYPSATDAAAIPRFLLGPVEPADGPPSAGGEQTRSAME